MILLADAGPATELIPSLAWAALRMLGAVVLLGAAAWVFLRWQKRGDRSCSDLTVVDRAFLTRGTSVALVRVAGRQLLLGVSADGVRLISDLESVELAPAPQEFETVLAEVPSRKVASG